MAVTELTTTSYAILGLLALRPWTTYELAQQMTRALGQFWPRAESNLYAEPKKLVALGLASAAKEAVGKRPRTVYSITDEGRRALADWMATPVATPGPVLEFEALVRVFFAEQGSKDDLVAAIEGVRAWAEERISTGVQIPRQYLEGKGPFPERLPWIVLAGMFLTEWGLSIGRWADWALGVVEDWPDDVRQAPPDWTILEDMTERLEGFLRARRGRATAPATADGDRSAPARGPLPPAGDRRPS